MAPINPAAVPITTTGVPQVQTPAGSAPPVAGQQAVPNTNQSVATSYGAPAVSTAPTSGYQSYAAAPSGQSSADIVNSFAPTGATGGGGVGDAIGALASFAQNKMQEIQGKVGALFKSDGGQPDMAAVQFLNTQMTSMVWVSEQAAKMQEKRERAMQVWVR